ncbi:MAG: hypothetical protein BroJett022_15380 [Actinomycetes bacterium]|nr:MAG: hypothetical protein BroJett022_15380 [Actinomycetes bacterium]
MDAMQDRLFDSNEQRTLIDHDHDPYTAVDEAGERIAADYGIDPERAADMVLAYGSELAARRVLDRRWWMKPEEKAPPRAA